jgi:DNA modification methylase
MSLRPYYEESGITIFHGDCREILPHLSKVDLLLTDPPYGIGSDRNLRANQQHGNAKTASKDYGAGCWDSVIPPAWMFGLMVEHSRFQIIWGGNYFPLPPSKCWLVWDKDNGDNGYADCELAWTNLDGAVRKIRWRWMGMLQEEMGARKEYRDHPTQKPVPVMIWCLKQAGEMGLDGDSVLDPFMGSGSTLVAAKRLGLRAIGIEIEEKYCEVAIERLRQEVLPFEVPIPEVRQELLFT